MPEINPLTNNQIFLKKIAENTGSEYETGDVSEINPLTIDQIFLKEIAANTAGQSGDISELEGKVADNTAAIEAIVDVTGSCNALKIEAITQTVSDIIFTVNADKSITINGTASDNIYFELLDTNKKSLSLVDGVEYKISGCPQVTGAYINYYEYYNSDWQLKAQDFGNGATFTHNGNSLKDSMTLFIPSGSVINNLTIYPMLYDARLKPTGYVPYAMTNRELTERFAVITGNTASDTNVTTFSYPPGFNINNTFIVTLAICINSYWYQYNNTTTFYAVTTNGSINVDAEDAIARNKPIKLLLMKV